MERIITKMVQDFEQGKMTRRQLIQSLLLAATAASAASASPAAAGDSIVEIKTAYINHISYEVADMARTRDFYSGLLGMKVSGDNGKRCLLSVGNSYIVARVPSSHDPKRGRIDADVSGVAPVLTSRVDHIKFGIANWETDKNVKKALEAALTRRGLKPRDSISGFNVYDPDGLHLQLGGKEIEVMERVNAVGESHSDKAARKP